MGNPKRTAGDKGHIEPFLTRAEKEILIHHVAFEGTSYYTYQLWCAEQGIPAEKQFTPAYWQKWRLTHKDEIDRIRLETTAALGKGDGGTRNRRLASLNEDLVTVKALIKGLDLDTPSGVEMFIKLSTRKQGLLQAIAQQRGEWGTKMSDDPAGRPATQLGNLFEKHFSAVDREGDE